MSAVCNISVTSNSHVQSAASPIPRMDKVNIMHAELEALKAQIADMQ